MCSTDMNIGMWTGFKCENRVQRQAVCDRRLKKKSGAIKDEEFCAHLSKCQLLKKGPTSRND